MNSKSYLNSDFDPLYILHFPGTGIEGHEYIIERELDRTIKISDNLSIVSIMEQKCWETSPLKIQCENNKIPIFNPALNETSWNNTLKIKYILQSLNEITTDYVLILDGRDTLIVNHLNDHFIQKYKQLNKPIIYNGTPVAYPKISIETLQELIQLKGKQKFLNAGVCIGERNALIDFYMKAEKINEQYPENQSEQYIIRLTRHFHPELAGHDEQNKLFRIIHQYDTLVKENKNTVILI